ncbi:hypothetical protein Nepgr_017572 [Nepenthes gracilis]|uniref:Uncharacterized protein n=1 Tax=Nepenthes gracilis TaxID=150966 RepID=A0AAD3SSA3_NEPGR|nr:hypothetical protein Nepgr_017572 [Nepenthes gracilis]
MGKAARLKRAAKKRVQKKASTIHVPSQDRTLAEINTAVNTREVRGEENDDIGIVEEAVVTAGEVGDDATQPSLEEDTATEMAKGGQSLVSSTPPAVERASWMNCCGVFEVLIRMVGRATG